MIATFRKPFLVLTSLCLITLFAGCIKNKVRVIVNADGSGHIVVSRIYAKEMVDTYNKQMEEMKMQMPASVEMPEDPFYNEDAIKMEAGQFGPGVEFLKSKEYSRGGSRGHVAVYKFADVNDIFINFESTDALGKSMSPAIAGMEEEMEIAEKGENAISFELESGPISRLRVDVPDYPSPSTEISDIPEDAASKPAFDGPEAAMMTQQMGGADNPYGISGSETRGEIVKKLMKGMAISVSIELKASGQESDAEHVSTTEKGDARYVIIDMDMDEILADDDSLRIFCADEDGGPMGSMMSSDGGLEFYSVMNGRPGMTLQTNDFVISFKGGQQN